MEFIEILWSYGEYTTAPLGYEYVVITLDLQNDGDQSITTSPHGWNLIAYVIKYEHDASTFNRSIGYQDMEIVKGRNIETKIVYLVKGNPTNIHLQFDGIWGIVRFLKRLTITWIELHCELVLENVSLVLQRDKVLLFYRADISFPISIDWGGIINFGWFLGIFNS